MHSHILLAGLPTADPPKAGNTQLVLATVLSIAVVVVLITVREDAPVPRAGPGLRRAGTGGVARRERRHRQLHQGRGIHDERRRPAHRARRHDRGAARRLGWRRRDRRHHRQPGERQRAAVGDGRCGSAHRPAAVLRGRGRAAHPGRPAGRVAGRPPADEDRHPGARWPVGAARPGAAPPRTARGHRRAQGRPGAHPALRDHHRHPHGHHRRATPGECRGAVRACHPSAGAAAHPPARACGRGGRGRGVAERQLGPGRPRRRCGRADPSRQRRRLARG